MYIDVPELARMPEEQRAQETERALRELVANINRTFEEIENKLEELKKKYAEKV